MQSREPQPSGRFRTKRVRGFNGPGRTWTSTLPRVERGVFRVRRLEPRAFAASWTRGSRLGVRSPLAAYSVACRPKLHGSCLVDALGRPLQHWLAACAWVRVQRQAAGHQAVRA
jgi:hypothetical protein